MTLVTPVPSSGFSVNSGSSSENYDLHLLNCSVPVYVYSSVRIFRLHLHGEPRYQRTLLYTVHLPFVLQTPLVPKSLRSVLVTVV